MTGETRIYVRLLDEGVDVWRPVAARPLGGDVFLVAEQLHDRQTESWQFEPGDAVVCETIYRDAGSFLAAVRRQRGFLG